MDGRRLPVVLTPAQGKARWEAMCDPSQGCQAACCHYEGSPCAELDQETLRCRVYDTRFGIRQTVAGVVFRCASMAERLMHHPAPPHCGYARVRAIQGRPVAQPENGMPVVAGMA